jgi:hypothetical protein
VGWYVYGIVEAGEGKLVVADVSGVDDAPVQVVGDADLQVVASPASARVRDLDRAPADEVLTAIRAHDSVLGHVARDRSVLPVRFGTVLPDDDALDAMTRDPEGGLRAALTRVAGADEWVVTVAAVEPDGPAADEPDDLSPGHAFFARRRSAADARQQARARAVDAAEELHDRLQQLARDWQVLELREPDTVARGAYLVPRSHADQAVALVDAVTGARASVQGPLPPYRFADTS